MNKKDALNPLADTSNKELLDNLCKWIDDNLDSNIGLAARVVELAKGKSTIEVVTHYSLFLLITNGSNTNTKPNRYAVCLSVMS
jgi:hypothetical protein